MRPGRVSFLFLNVGHTYAHLFMLLYPTVVLALEAEFQRPYGVMLALATPGFVAFGAGALPAGWLGDRWSRRGMMTVFFIGLGVSSILTGLARTPTEIAAGLTLIGVFASIYHPVGIAMVVNVSERVGRALGVNGVWGNMGVAFAALVAGGLTDFVGWRAAFIVPGMVALATGVGHMAFAQRQPAALASGSAAKAGDAGVTRQAQIRVFGVIIVATLLGSLVFHSLTVGMPKLFDERMAGLADTTFGIGGLISAIYAVAAFTQILVGWMIDRYPLKPVFLGVVVLQPPLFLAAASLSGPALLAGALAMMLLVLGQIPINDTLVARNTIDAWRARVYAVKFSLALGVSAGTVPMVAYIHDTGGGFATLFLVLAAFAAVITLAVLFLPADRRRRVAVLPAGE